MIYFVHSIVLYIFIGVCKNLQTQISSVFECGMKVLYNFREFLKTKNASSSMPPAFLAILLPIFFVG